MGVPHGHFEELVSLERLLANGRVGTAPFGRLARSELVLVFFMLSQMLHGAGICIYVSPKTGQVLQVNIQDLEHWGIVL